MLMSHVGKAYNVDRVDGRAARIIWRRAALRDRFWTSSYGRMIHITRQSYDPRRPGRAVIRFTYFAGGGVDVQVWPVFYCDAKLAHPESADVADASRRLCKKCVAKCEEPALTG